jgi:hypothetical protein
MINIYHLHVSTIVTVVVNFWFLCHARPAFTCYQTHRSLDMLHIVNQACKLKVLGDSIVRVKWFDSSVPGRGT